MKRIKEGNRLCFDRMLKESYRSHEQIVKKIKPLVDDRSQHSLKFKKLNLKRQQSIQFRNSQIQHCNNLLFKNLKRISTRRFSVVKMPWRKLSQHRHFQARIRQKDLERSTANKQILKRLTQQHSLYQKNQLLFQRSLVEKNISMICKYGYKGKKGTQTFCNLFNKNPPKHRQSQHSWDPLHFKLKF